MWCAVWAVSVRVPEHGMHVVSRLLGGVFWKRTGGPVAHGGFGRAGHSRLSAYRCVPGTGHSLVHLQLLPPASPMDGGGHVISNHSALCVNGLFSYQVVTLFISGNTLCSTSTWSGSNLCLVLTRMRFSFFELPALCGFQTLEVSRRQ